MGFTAINAQGLSAPPYFVSFLLTILSAGLADRLQQRGLTVIVLSLLSGVGYILLAATDAVGARYFGVCLAAIVFPVIANILPWVTNNQGSDTRRGVNISLINLIGQCGPLLGTNVFPPGDAPRYVRGLSICAAFIFFNALLALTLRCLLVWENRKLDRKYGPVGAAAGGGEQKARAEEMEGEASVGVENYAPKFRYVL